MDQEDKTWKETGLILLQHGPETEIKVSGGETNWNRKADVGVSGFDLGVFVLESVRQWDYTRQRSFVRDLRFQSNFE
jgi:hypothetical protein